MSVKKNVAAAVCVCGGGGGQEARPSGALNKIRASAVCIVKGMKETPETQDLEQLVTLLTFG